MAMRRVAAFAVLLVLFLALYARLGAQFVPSAPALWLGWAVAAACAAGGGIFALRWQPKAAAATTYVGRHRWARLLLFAPVCALVGFYAAATGFGALYTGTFGQQASRTAIVAHWRFGRPCIGPVLEGAPLFGTELCDRHELPRGSTVILRGLETPLGLQVFAIEPAAR